MRADVPELAATFIERSTGELALGPPQSKAGRRVVGIPEGIVPALREHLATYVQDDPGALLFPAAKGGPLRRNGFNTRTRWVDVVKQMGLPGLHFHDLRHTGNMLAAESGAGLKDLMARMGHDNVRAANRMSALSQRDSLEACHLRSSNAPALDTQCNLRMPCLTTLGMWS
ncbi:tyrosine-type recombinase/integrase [Microbispora hainanensis]|uniref:Tyrosine-type recombinase/integrase n=1 Tax=Microbispora hainanensis TaxID=568844 RepID=A0ABZ1SIR1_9ACTN|nr:tyrosine-type recombinase/integrase [Microbispora hainanensis]